jgi:hypothetical protein
MSTAVADAEDPTELALVTFGMALNRKGFLEE